MTTSTNPLLSADQRVCLDTIRVRFRETPTDLQLRDHWTAEKTVFQKSGEIVRYFWHWTHLGPNSAVVKAAYRPKDFTGNPLLSVEFSLPRLVLGNNYSSYEDLHEALAEARKIIADHPALPHLDLLLGTPQRLDIGYMFDVGELVDTYLDQISQKCDPTAKFDHYRNEKSVRFRTRSKRATVIFYNKERQSRCSAAHGLLRAELQLKGPGLIRSRMSFPKGTFPTLSDLTQDWIEEELGRNLKLIGVLNLEFVSQIVLAKRIRREGATTCEIAKEYTIAHMVSTYGKRRTALALGVSPRLVTSILQRLKDRGIYPQDSKTSFSLPPLRLPASQQGALVSLRSKVALGKDDGKPADKESASFDLLAFPDEDLARLLGRDEADLLSADDDQSPVNDEEPIKPQPGGGSDEPTNGSSGAPI